MNKSTDSALARLHAADPAATQLVPDPRSVVARAMLAQLLASIESTPVRRATRRRVLVGGAVAAAAAAATVVGVVATPWSNGHPASAAYAVDKHADGSVSVSVHWDELRDPAALNAKLAQLGARTVVMARSAAGECTTPVAIDPAHSGVLHVDLGAHPELRDPATFRAYIAAQMPWIDWHDSSDDAAGFTIHPDAIPAGDTFLIPYEFVATQRPDGSSGGDALSALGLIVPAVPSCVPAVGDGDISGVQAR